MLRAMVRSRLWVGLRLCFGGEDGVIGSRSKILVRIA